VSDPEDSAIIRKHNEGCREWNRRVGSPNTPVEPLVPNRPDYRARKANRRGFIDKRQLDLVAPVRGVIHLGRMKLMRRFAVNNTFEVTCVITPESVAEAIHNPF
jgi:hypothetical protein